MTFSATPLAGAYVIGLEPFNDERGWFARYYCRTEFQQIGHKKDWVQLNQSVSYVAGTVRGMHFQHPPFREIKLVRCVTGAVYDVIADIRKDSPTFLQCFGIELSGRNNTMLYIPEGFAHGFQTLEDNTTLLYHHTEAYTPGAEGGLRHDDPALSIHWPLPVTVISGRDAGHPFIDKNFKGV